MNRSADRPALFNSSIAKGLTVLEVFENGRGSLSLTQIAANTGLEKSAAQRFTATFVRLGYLRKDPATRRYSLSPRILRFCASYSRTSPLIERSTPYLLDWNRHHEETVSLGEIDNTEVIVVSRFRARHVVSPGVVVGSRFSWHVLSIGQAITAFLPESEQRSLLKRTELVRYASRSITSSTALLKRLEQVKKDGYALCHEESFDEDISIGAPVFDASGNVVAGVGIAVLATQWNVEEARRKLAPLVRELAKAISSSSRAAHQI